MQTNYYGAEYNASMLIHDSHQVVLQNVNIESCCMHAFSALILINNTGTLIIDKFVFDDSLQWRNCNNTSAYVRALIIEQSHSTSVSSMVSENVIKNSIFSSCAMNNGSHKPENLELKNGGVQFGAGRLENYIY